MMGYGYGYGMGAGGWIAMIIFWVGVITLVVWAVSRATAAGSGAGLDTRPLPGSPQDDNRNTAEDILDRRFAAGELDDVTYRSMLATLRATRTESR